MRCAGVCLIASSADGSIQSLNQSEFDSEGVGSAVRAGNRGEERRGREGGGGEDNEEANERRAQYNGTMKRTPRSRKQQQKRQDPTTATDSKPIQNDVFTIL